MIICPYCAKKFDPMESSHDDNLRAIMGISAIFGKESPLVWAYLELFGVVPFRKRARKLRVLMDDMKRLWELERFTYRKKEYGITRRGIAGALHTVTLHHFTDRLTNHNYLKKIMMGIAEKEAESVGKQAERDLREKENRLRKGEKIPTPEECEENLRRVGNILKGLK